MTGIHDGTHLLFCSKGDAFGEATYRFTQNAIYQRMDTTIPFQTTETQYSIWEVTLYGVAGGTWDRTLSIRRISPEIGNIACLASSEITDGLKDARGQHAAGRGSHLLKEALDARARPLRGPSEAIHDAARPPELALHVARVALDDGV